MLLFTLFFSTAEAFNAVDSAKSFNLGAPVNNQLNWTDKIKLFYFQSLTGSPDIRPQQIWVAVNSQTAQRKHQTPPTGFHQQGLCGKGPRAQVPDHTHDKSSLLDHTHQRCSVEDPAATPLTDRPQGKEPAADVSQRGMSDRREQPRRHFCLRRWGGGDELMRAPLSYRVHRTSGASGVGWL